MKWEASSGDALTTIYVGNDVKLTWEEGGGDFSPKYSGESVYFYNGNRLIVAGTSTDVKITKVVVSFSGSKFGLVSARAGEERNTGFCSIEVDTEGLVSGDLEVTATVTVEGEAAETLNDNTMTVPINVYESTGIESLTPALSECEGAVYNLQGVKVKTLQKGNIYIVNGRKMLVK